MSHNKKSKPGIIEIILLTVGKGLWLIISWPFKKLFKIKSGSVTLDRAANLTKWMEIEKLLHSKDEIHAKHAVVEADKFFEGILKLKGAMGETFADRFRSLENHFSKENYQLVWQAHRMRNQISHEQGFRANVEECRLALTKFKKGLENLGAI